MAKAKIPGGITPEHFIQIRNLLNEVLKDIETATGREPKWVSSRLNETARDDVSPFFVGWVENEELRSKRVSKNLPDPGLFRFADNIHTRIYAECLDVKGPGGVKRRDWAKDGAEMFGKNLYVSHVGLFDLHDETHRRSIAIKMDKRYVGTLNAGLSKDLGVSIDRKLQYWAQDPKSALVQYLSREFELAGPVCL